mgnify:FL=1
MGKKNFADYANRFADDVVQEMVDNEVVAISFDDNPGASFSLNINNGLSYNRTVRINVDSRVYNDGDIAVVDELVEQFVAGENDMVVTGAYFDTIEDVLCIDVREHYDWDEGDAPLVKDIMHEVDGAVAFIIVNADKLNNMLVATVE